MQIVHPAIAFTQFTHLLGYDVEFKYVPVEHCDTQDQPPVIELKA